VLSLHDAMRGAPTTRRFAADPIDRAALHRALDHARFAPSAGNRQPWRVVVVTDPVTRRAIRDLYLPHWRAYLEETGTAAAVDRVPVLREADAFARARAGRGVRPRGAVGRRLRAASGGRRGGWPRSGGALASPPMAKIRIQPHSRLQEWVAEDEGFFREEGLDYEFDPAGFIGGSVYADATVKPADAAPLDIRSGAFEDMEAGRTCDVSGACHWAVNHAATASHGRMWGRAYSVCVSGIFVAPDAPYERPDDLAGVKVGVGYHSGSHYSAIQGLEPFLDREQIALDFVGRPWDRVRLMCDRRIAAANVFGAQYYILEQLGFRKLVDTTFIMGFMVGEAASTEDMERYFRALRHAQREIDLDADRYKHHWRREMPDDLRDTVDVRRFGPGERIVFEPYTRDMFERTHRWMERWELFDASAVVRPSYEDAVIA
jgi:NitT/TauT family transport system substrate-binding protein